MTRKEALDVLRKNIPTDKSLPVYEALQTLIPELRESEDERIRKIIYNCVYECCDTGYLLKDDRNSVVAWLEKQKESLHIPETCKENADSFTDIKDRNIRGCIGMALADISESRFKMYGVTLKECLAWLERQKEPENTSASTMAPSCWEVEQKEQKPIIQDVELNDAVYDYVRDHFIAGADFTPEYIKKLMENAFFAGVDYYLLKQESESCESDTNIEKVIEDVIRVYGKTQGEWVGGYDVDTLIVNLRRAFNKKEQKPEWSEEDEDMLNCCISSIEEAQENRYAYKETDGDTSYDREIDWLKSLRPQPSWKPSEEQMAALEAATVRYQSTGLESLYEELKKQV